MRRVSYQFPNRCDLEFEVDVPFPIFLDKVAGLSGKQDNFRNEKGPVKREIAVSLAHDRLGFEPILPGTQMSRMATEGADILVTLTDSLLKASGNMPLAEHKFMVRTIEKADRTEVFITKAVQTDGFDSMDMKMMILGVLS